MNKNPDLRLDLRAKMLRGGDSGLAAVVPGKPEKSYLIEVINHVDEDMAMPPDEDKLPAEEIDLLTRWIKEGAVWPGQMDQVDEREIGSLVVPAGRASGVPKVAVGSAVGSESIRRTECSATIPSTRSCSSRLRNTICLSRKPPILDH